MFHIFGENERKLVLCFYSITELNCIFRDNSYRDFCILVSFLFFESEILMNLGSLESLLSQELCKISSSNIV